MKNKKLAETGGIIVTIPPGTDLNDQNNLFPVEVFPEAVQKIIKATNLSLGFPTDFIGASLLYAVSVAIGNTHRVEILRGYLQAPVLYLALVGRPGTNKTAPLKWALTPIESRDNRKFREYKKEKELYDFISALPKKDRQGNAEPVKPTWEQLLVTDFTPEALVSVHSSNPRGLGVNVDELASWFKNFNRYNKGSEQEFWLSAWSGTAVKVNRKTSDPQNIPKPFISVAGGIQPGVLNELAANRTENGFLDRMLFAMPDDLKKEYWSEKELDPVIIQSWHDIISKLLNLPMNQDAADNPQPEVLKFTAEAKRHMFQWQKKLTDRSNRPENEDSAGIDAKIEMYALRFSLILQVLRYACEEGNKRAIDLESAQNAIKLAEYFKFMSVKVLSFVSNANPLDRLPTDKQKLYEALPGTFTTSGAVKIANKLGVPERTIKRFLSSAELFNNLSRGNYEKRY